MRKIVDKFVPQGGKHCITNSLKQIFYYHGIEMSEEMMLGLGSGLSFLYLNQAASPMINGRCKIFEFEEKLAQRLNINIRCKTGSNYEKIQQKTKEMLDKDNPILIYVDMPYLKYLGLNENSHFGGHAVVLFGYDEEKQEYLISDRDNHDFPIRTPFGHIAEDYHLVSFDELKQARTSTHRPFPAKCKYLEIDFNGYLFPDRMVLAKAIKETCNIMLNPPAKLLGLNGINKFSKEILKWRNFTPEKLKLAGVTNYFQISKDGGTGGGIFRKMYGNFLIEAAPILENSIFEKLGSELIEIGEAWDQIAELMWELSLGADTALLMTMSEMIHHIWIRETNIISKLAQEADSI